MKKSISILSFLAILNLSQSCATIVGGSRYNANVIIKDHPHALIAYKGEYKGTGRAFIQAKRKEANTFSVSVKEEGCKEQIVNFTSRSFRGGAFVGTVILFTGIASGVPLPWGVALDLATGALWKPNVNEPGIVKVNHKLYMYSINYSGCSKRDSIAVATSGKHP